MPPTPKKKPTLEEISQRFHLPLQKAADDMGKCIVLSHPFPYLAQNSLRNLPNSAQEVL